MSHLEKHGNSEELSPELWMAMSSVYSRFNRKTVCIGLLKFTVADNVLGSQAESQGGWDRPIVVAD